MSERQNKVKSKHIYSVKCGFLISSAVILSKFSALFALFVLQF
jgi:hypothetical protein